MANHKKRKALTRIPVGSSFRDPSGEVYTENGTLFRAVNPSYQQTYQNFMASGLYERLVKDSLLIPHQEITKKKNSANIIIQPEYIPFLSYPYEWCFGELKDAAITTLKIEKTALSYGFTLKDASAYNIQWQNGKPVFIDTLSFERYVENSLWIAYRQFCMHFLAPLLLMSQKNPDLNKLLLYFLDGIPLPLVSALLPKMTYMNPSLLTHIHLHAFMEKKFSGKKGSRQLRGMKKESFIAMLDNLTKTIQQLRLPTNKSYWSEYSELHVYGRESFIDKKRTVNDFIKQTSAKTALDIGANTGEFTAICTGKNIRTVAIDNDHISVERLYQSNTQTTANCLPLVLDITNPSPAIGWANEERLSFVDRGPFDLVLALAIIHHIAIERNIPLSNIIRLFSRLGTYVIVEFVPKQDAEVQTMLSNREDIFSRYSQKEFERECNKLFTIRHIKPVVDSVRVLYLLQNKHSV